MTFPIKIGRNHGAPQIMRLPTRDIRVSTSLLRNLLDVAEECESNQIISLQRFGMSADEMFASKWMSLHKYIAVSSEILKASEESALGLLAGDRLTLRDQGLFAYAVASCANLNQAIDVYRKYSHINGSFIFGDIEIIGDEASFSFDASAIAEWPELHRFEVEQEFALWFKIRFNWQQDERWFSRVEFEFPNTRDHFKYQDYFGCHVAFSQPVNRFTFDTKYLTKRFSTADETLFRLTEEQCGRLLEELPGAKGITGEIRMMFARAGGQYPTFDQVASEYNMSEATLRRRLSAEGTNFKLLLRQFRVELAMRYLSETNLSVSAIADLTGYSDPASFSRAFFESTEVRPGTFRGKRAQMPAS